jgi:hypothetical protein
MYAYDESRFPFGPGRLSHSLWDFPHAAHGKYEGPLGLDATDLLECRLDHDKFEIHTPLGVPPTFRRLGSSLPMPTGPG